MAAVHVHHGMHVSVRRGGPEQEQADGHEREVPATVPHKCREIAGCDPRPPSLRKRELTHPDRAPRVSGPHVTIEIASNCPNEEATTATPSSTNAMFDAARIVGIGEGKS